MLNRDGALSLSLLNSKVRTMPSTPSCFTLLGVGMLLQFISSMACIGWWLILPLRLILKCQAVIKSDTDLSRTDLWVSKDYAMRGGRTISRAGLANKVSLGYSFRNGCRLES